MIIRIFRVQIKPPLRHDFERDFVNVSIPLIQSHPGLLSVKIGKPTRWAPDEYVMISHWKSVEDIRDFVGEEWYQPLIPNGMEKYVVQTWVHHFEEF